MNIVIMDVTPAMAFEWLKKNIANRKLSPTLITKYSNDVLSGRWFLTHQGIAFDTNGSLRDGQHRLFAVCLSEKSMKMPVAFDVPLDSFSAIDNGKSRTFQDNEAIAGRPLPKEYVPTLRGMLIGEGRMGQVTTNQAFRAISAAYDEAIKFSISCFNQQESPQGLKSGTVMGVVARAFYSQSHEDLKRFGRIFVLGIPDDAKQDEAALKIRNWKLINVHCDKRELYLKTERALFAFLAHEPLSKLYDASEELFPIPAIPEQAVQTDSRVKLKKLLDSLNGNGHKKD